MPTAEPFVLSRHSNALTRGVGEPLPTVEVAAAAVAPRRLVLLNGQPYLLDIRFRMLTNRERARAMGVDDGDSEYECAGSASEVTRQIGNEVAVNLAAALVGAILDDRPAAERTVA